MSKISQLIQPLEHWFEHMWLDYLALNPDAQLIYDLLSQNNTVTNDHVAFRTFGLPGMRVDDIAKPLLAAGYTEKNEYHFAEKKLRAKHFAHPTKPLIFISELIVEAFSDESQRIIKELASQLDLSKVSQLDFLYSGRQWQLESKEYENLLAESEYAAWVAAFGFRPNHFTVCINDLNNFNSIMEVNEFLKANGIVLNSSGGEVKGSKAVYLEQSSTMANKVEVNFTDKTMVVPSCFYEFAFRHKLENGELFKGFVAASADKIFESTNTKAA